MKFLTLNIRWNYFKKLLGMKIYKANKKGMINYLLLVFFLLPVIVVLSNQDSFIKNTLKILPLFIPLSLLIWAYLDTYYKIEKTLLIYRSAFLRGKIEIASIREIVKGTTVWVGLKPSLATKGMLVKFNKFDEIYIAPVSNEELIADLLKTNPKIIVKD